MVNQLLEHQYTGQFLSREVHGISRDVLTFDNTAGTLDLLVPAGTVFAYEPPGTSVVATTGNTGTGTITNVQANLVAVQTGTYQVILLTPTTFNVIAPDGTDMPNGVVGTAYLNGIGFQLNAGGTAFAANDTFSITIANGAAPVVTHAGTNVGNGTLTNVEVVQTATAKPGNYIVKFTAATTFIVLDPSGVQLATGNTGTYYEDRIGFLATAGGTAFVAGDSFTIGISTGTGLATAWNGTAPAAGIVYNTDYVPAGGTLVMTGIFRSAEVIASCLQFPIGTTAAQQQTCFNQLRAIGIIPR